VTSGKEFDIAKIKYMVASFVVFTCHSFGTLFVWQSFCTRNRTICYQKSRNLGVIL